MRFNSHSRLVGSHAFLSASNYHWINYTEDKLDAMFVTAMAARRGVELHELAHRLIRLGVKLPETTQTLNQYVNDAIGYRMTPEQLLYFSDNAYGTADVISFRKNTLRIFDLKTGETDASVNQLLVYAAFFCLEYGYNPLRIEIDLRIYQKDEVRLYETDPDQVMHIMDRIKVFDKRINEMRMEAYE